MSEALAPGTALQMDCHAMNMGTIDNFVNFDNLIDKSRSAAAGRSAEPGKAPIDS
jgi:hypothetical protein